MTSDRAGEESLRVGARVGRALAAALVAGLSLLGCEAGQGAPTVRPAGAHSALAPAALAAGETLHVVATTSIVADIVAQIGGHHLVVQTLLPVGTDPHAFDPSPRDLAAVANADVVFANGAGLEEFLGRLLDSASDATPLVELSEGIALRALDADAHEADEHAGIDPHTWTSPANAIVFVRNAERALRTLDPAHADEYGANADAYVAELERVDAWIAERIATLPDARRLLVTDHLIFGYYADRYGLRQVGAVIPGFSTGAAPSAKELAEIEDSVRRLGVPAIFAGASVNPALAERVAADTGVVLATLYTGSLGPAGSGADTYLGYLRHNTNTIVEALR